MHRRFAQIRRRNKLRAHRTLTVSAQPGHAAIFLDGRFLGFGTGRAEVIADAPHYVVGMAEGFSPRAQTIGPHHGAASSEQNLSSDDEGCVRMDLLAESSPMPEGYASLVAASQRDTTFPDPSAPLLRAWSIDTVLVLAYNEGALRLTTFDLRQGQRHATQAAATVTDLRDAAIAAAELISNAPPLAVVPNAMPRTTSD